MQALRFSIQIGPRHLVSVLRSQGLDMVRVRCHRHLMRYMYRSAVYNLIKRLIDIGPEGIRMSLSLHM